MPSSATKTPETATQRLAPPFYVAQRVRVERDETRYPSRGSWPMFSGKRGTVVILNDADNEIGVAFGAIGQRPDGSLKGSNGPTWFLSHELVSLEEVAADGITL